LSFAIIRGSNGRRHDVDFGEDPIAVDVAASRSTVQITVEAPQDLAPSDKRRFATLCLPRERLLAALKAALQQPPDRTGRPPLRLVTDPGDDDA
jgi:hypothetical protein